MNASQKIGKHKQWVVVILNYTSKIKMLTIYGNSYIKLNSSTTTQANVINGIAGQIILLIIGENIFIRY